MKSNRYLFSMKVYQLSVLIHYMYRYIGNVSRDDWEINDVWGNIGQFISRWNVHREFVYRMHWFIVIVRIGSNVAFYTNYNYNTFIMFTGLSDAYYLFGCITRDFE